jgi:hypothetical protein
MYAVGYAIGYTLTCLVLAALIVAVVLEVAFVAYLARVEWRMWRGYDRAAEDMDTPQLGRERHHHRPPSGGPLDDYLG